MLESIKPYLWIAELVLVAILALCCVMGGYSYAHKDVVIVQGKLDNALDANKLKDAVLKDCNDATVEAQRQEAAAALREKAANAKLKALQETGPKIVKIFVDKQDKLEQQPECAVLKEHICPAAMDY
jgi:hypothetical protein